MKKQYGLFTLVLVLSLVLFQRVPAITLGRQIDSTAENFPDVPAGLTVAEWSSITGQIEANRYRVRPGEIGGYRAVNQAQSLRADFSEQGVSVTSPGGRWGLNLQLVAYGYEGALQAVSQPKLTAAGNRLDYTWDENLSEWWLNTATGLEQGFTLQQRPAQKRNTILILDMALQTGLTPVQAGEALHFLDENNAVVLTYDKLVVNDVHGKRLPASMRLAGCDGSSSTGGCKLQVAVDDRAATYPLLVDPVVQQAYIKASNTGGGDYFGQAVAISGETLVVGAYQEDSDATGVNGSQGDGATTGNSGAAYVFVRNGSTWSQQAYLKASNTGENDQFGWAVAISGDTIVIGAPYEGSNATGTDGDGQEDDSAYKAGAAYVFVRSGTNWSQQAYIKASNTEADDHFGASVAVSGDSMVIGAWAEDSNAKDVNGNESDESSNDAGAAYAFYRTGAAWEQEAYLKASNTGAGDYFGWSLAFSGDTLVVGAFYEDSNATGIGGSDNNYAADSGAAYTFVRSGGTWSKQAYLKASNTEMNDHFGRCVSISGNVIVVGAPDEDSNAVEADGDQEDNSAPDAGAAYVFIRDGSTWNGPTYLKASNTDEEDRFGWWVGASGETLIVGAPGEDSNAKVPNGDQNNDSAFSAGAAYLFLHSSTSWVQRAYLKASNSDDWDEFGTAVALSGDTLVAGALNEDNSQIGINPASAGENEIAVSSGSAYVFTASFNVAVSGNGQIIPNGDVLPTLSDGTDFGGVYPGAPASHTFTISYTGGPSLTVNAVTLSGPTSTYFDVSGISLPATIATGGNTNFVVTFDPPSPGIYSATVTIANNDSDENPYTFVIRGVSPLLATVTTQVVTNIGASNATGNGTITALGIPNPTAHGMVWNTTGNPTVADAFSDEGTASHTGAFTSTMTGLIPNTTYYVRAYATNLAGSAYGSQVSFKTDVAALGSVTTQAVTDIGAGSATGNGTITNLGDPNPTAHGMVWGTSHNPTLAGAFSDEGIAEVTGAFTSTMTGLIPETTYYARAYTTNYAGTVYGGEVIFTTTTAISPSVTTQAVTEIGAFAAIGNGTITELGDPNPTAHGMAWNTTGNPTLADDFSDDGAAEVSGAFTSTITGLLPETTYYVRAYATNYAGTVYGQQVTFKTTVAPAEIDVFGNGVLIASGSVTPSLANGTDFGGIDMDAGAVTHTFMISNTGSLVLNLTGDPVVAISGPNASDFQVVAQPAASIAGGTTVTFQVRFVPSALGTRTATISIASNDSDENPYTFVIQGTGGQAGYRIYLPLLMRN